MSRVCDILDAELHGFTPFNDAYQLVTTEVMVATYDVTTDGINTTAEDPFRQGVEIATNKQRFIGMLPKIWAGNVCGYTRINTYGQFENYVQFTGNTLYNDRLIKFNPVMYIENPDEYPYPLIFNDGPQQKFEASIEPLTILFRKNTNEIVSETAHDIKGSIGIEGSIVEQFEKYYFSQQSDHQWFFLDSGAKYFGPTTPLSNSIAVPGYISKDVSAIRPFDDTMSNGLNNPLIKQLSTTNTSLVNLLMSSSMDYNLDDDIRDVYGCRSKSAGYDSYGPNAKIYGTDSIAFIGLTRGA